MEISITNKTKACSKCKEEKLLSEFHKSPKHKYGVRSICKVCINSQNIAYRNSHLDEERERKKKYIKSHKEEIAKQRHEYWSNNKGCITINRNKYRKLHADKIRKQRSKYMKMFRDKNPHERVANNCRNRITYALKAQSTIKSYKSQELIGCSFKQLKLYIESKFSNGMNWDNYGLFGWHIDHIKPCSSFDLTDPEQQKQCFHYTNLQPLWAEDNLRKSNHYSKKS